MKKSLAESMREILSLLEQGSPLTLPPIPSGYVRLTHFTSPNIVNKIISQHEPFTIRGQLSGTTDPFTNEEDLKELIKMGQTGAFTRSGFGTQVLLMDLSYQEHKRLIARDTPIANSRIVGYVDRETMQFHKNPAYHPQGEQPLPKPVAINNRRDPPLPIPSPSSQRSTSAPEDIF
jgi:hypothetical protein